VICVSTRGLAPAVSFREALFAGLAPDGGLYVPQLLPVLDPAVWTAARGASMAEIGTAMLGPLLEGEIDIADLEPLLAEALDFPVTVMPLASGLSVPVCLPD
jgi:threonine synthase